MEHPVNEAGLMLPGRRDVFVAAPPGRSNLDLSDFVMPDYHRQSVVMISIEYPDTGDVVTLTSSGETPVVKFDAPIGGDKVHASFDIDFLAHLISVSHQKWGKPTNFLGVTARPT
jgi:hypothetical protein